MYIRKHGERQRECKQRKGKDRVMELEKEKGRK